MNVPLVKCGIDFTPNIKNLISKTIKGFNYEVEEEVGALVDEFMFENWSSVVERVDMQCSPYTMTRDQYFVLDKIPGMEQVTATAFLRQKAPGFRPHLRFARCLCLASYSGVFRNAPHATTTCSM